MTPYSMSIPCIKRVGSAGIFLQPECTATRYKTLQLTEDSSVQDWTILLPAMVRELQ